MRKLLVDAYSEIKLLPKAVWFAAVIVPGGFAAITVYLASRTAYKNFKKKEDTDDRSENRS